MVPITTSGATVKNCSQMGRWVSSAMMLFLSNETAANFLSLLKQHSNFFGFFDVVRGEHDGGASLVQFAQ